MSQSSSLIDHSSAVLAEANAHSARAACWIARAALESAVDELLDSMKCSAPSASMRNKLTVLQVACDTADDLPARADYAWNRLSQACHHHAFELSPTATEVRHLIQVVSTIVPETPNLPVA